MWPSFITTPETAPVSTRDAEAPGMVTPASASRIFLSVNWFVMLEINRFYTNMVDGHYCTVT
jgi:hypothetical protein